MRTLALLAGALAAIMLVGAACKSKQPPAPPPPTPKADFKAGEVRVLDPDERPEAAAAGNAQVLEVLSFLNRYYDAAFLDPKHFRAGARDLLPLFGPEAQPNVTPNIEALAMGDLAGKIARVKPTKQLAERVSLFLERDQSIGGAVVTVLFQGLATRKVEGAPRVDIEHRATFWLTRDAEGYKITTFETQLKADSKKVVSK